MFDLLGYPSLELGVQLRRRRRRDSWSKKNRHDIKAVEGKRNNKTKTDRICIKT